MTKDYKVMVIHPYYKLAALNDVKRDDLKGVVAMEIEIGDKLMAANPYSKKDCLELEKEINKVGLITRVAQNCESKMWSVAIIGEDDGTYRCEN